MFYCRTNHMEPRNAICVTQFNWTNSRLTLFDIDQLSFCIAAIYGVEIRLYNWPGLYRLLIK